MTTKLELLPDELDPKIAKGIMAMKNYCDKLGVTPDKTCARIWFHDDAEIANYYSLIGHRSNLYSPALYYDMFEEFKYRPTEFISIQDIINLYNEE